MPFALVTGHLERRGLDGIIRHEHVSDSHLFFSSSSETLTAELMLHRLRRARLEANGRRTRIVRARESEHNARRVSCECCSWAILYRAAQIGKGRSICFEKIRKKLRWLGVMNAMLQRMAEWQMYTTVLAAAVKISQRVEHCENNTLVSASSKKYRVMAITMLVSLVPDLRHYLNIRMYGFVWIKEVSTKKTALGLSSVA